MSNIVLIQQPSSGVVPVANGIEYVVNSPENENRTGVKYIADVYVENTKVGRLKNNRNYSANGYGVFDTSRLVENFVKTAINPPTSTTSVLQPNNDAIKATFVRFGIEHDRFIQFKQVDNIGGKATLRFKYSTGITTKYNPANSLKYVYIVSSTPLLSGWHKIQTIGSDYITLTTTYSSAFATVSGVVYEAQFGTSTRSWTDSAGVQRMSILQRSSQYNYFNIGDTIYVSQTGEFGGASVLAYDGECKIVDIKVVTISSIQYVELCTNKVFTTTSSATLRMYSTDKYRFENFLTSNTTYAADAGIQYEYYNPTYMFKFKFQYPTGGGGNFLTEKSDRTFKVPSSNRSFTLSTSGNFGFNSSTVQYYTITLFRSDNSTIGSYNIVPPIPQSFGRNEIYVSPYQLRQNNSMFNTNLNNGTLSYYSIRAFAFITGIPRQVSQTYVIKVDYDCSRYDVYTLKFKNRVGGWEYAFFKARTDKKITISRENYRKNLKGYSSTRTPQYGYSIGDRGLTTYGIDANYVYTANSGYLSNVDAQWMEELFTSTDVYWVKEDSNTHIPITLNVTDITIGSKKNVGLINYVVEFQTSNNLVIQRS